MLTGQQVAKHNTRDDCWVIIEGKAYDVTEFLPNHPGGPNIILRYAGKDATEEYAPIHPPGTLDELEPSKHLGEVDPSTVERSLQNVSRPSQEAKEKKTSELLPLSALLSLHDIEEQASKTLSAKAWAYYNSSANDTFTHQSNLNSWKNIVFRPRVMRNMEKVDVTTDFLGQKSSLPFFIAPAALAKLAHPDGESALCRAAGRLGIPQVISSNASSSVEEIANAKSNPDQILHFQLYVNRDRKKSEQLLDRAVKAGCSAIWVTVDNAMSGKREQDERYKVQMDMESGVSGTGGDGQVQGIGAALGSYIDEKLNWSDIAWLRSRVNLPIVLKGIQTSEDALLAMKHGCEGICISNHGGRQLDSAPSTTSVLVELNKYCPQVFQKMDVFIDGGLRRGTDIVKAMCLGCKSVGLGRPPLLALSGYGEAGVIRMAQILYEECIVAMRLIGANSFADLNPNYVNTRVIEMANAEPSFARRWFSKL